MLLTTDDMMILSGLKVSIRKRIQNKPVMDFASRDIGDSQEFNDYQQFTPGENIRHIDWNRYMRDSTLFSRRYEKLERPEVTVIPDLSRSVVVSGKTKAVKRFSAAICFSLLNKGMTVRLFSNRSFERYSGKSGWQRVHHDIELLDGGNTKMLSLSPAASSMSKNVVVVSDLIFSDGFGQFKENINIANRLALLINLSSSYDHEPDLNGNLKLLDSQNDKTLPCYIDSRMIARYKKCRADYYHQIEKHCLKMDWQYKDVNLEDSLQNQLLTIAPAGTLYV